MKNISILPLEYKQKQKKYKMISIYMLVAALAVIAYTVSMAGIYVGNQNLKRELRIIEMENNRLSAEIASLEVFKTAQDKIKSVHDLVGKAAGTNPDWKNLLDKVFAQMPENTWVSDITCSYKNDSGEFIVKGFTSDNTNVSEWMNRLKNIRELKDMDCKLSTDDQQTIRYEIWATISKGKAWSLNLDGGNQP